MCVMCVRFSLCLSYVILSCCLRVVSVSVSVSESVSVCLPKISLTVRGVEQLAWSGTANAEESGTCCSRLTLDLWWVRSCVHFGESQVQVTTLRRPFFGELYWRWGMNLTLGWGAQASVHQIPWRVLVQIHVFSFAQHFFRSLVNLTNERREKSSQGLRRRTCRGTIHAFQIHVCATTFTILIFSIFVDGLKMDDGCLGSNNDEGGNEMR